jgi:hypothetical protein
MFGNSSTSKPLGPFRVTQANRKVTPVGGEDHRLAFVAAIDYFIEQVGGLIVEGKIADFIDTQQAHVGIAAQLTAAALRRLAMQLFE